ncbi:MAG: MoaD/ThiS family protein [Candidatus Micrarchaeota archaeon]|nr:MoaD/ThiS family protein [Candidatus Micrarchaeota archaeon]
MLKVYIDGKYKKIEKNYKTIEELLKELEISKQIALVKVNGKLTPAENPFPKNGKIEIIRVVFGG